MTRRNKELFRQKSNHRARPPVAGEAAAEESVERIEMPRATKQSTPKDDDGSGLRLQKVMAAAGVGSRRHCEELILAGRVEVDGRTVRKLGTKVEPSEQEIRVDGEVLKTKRTKVYFLVNKPDGVVCTNYDPAGRTRVVDLVPSQDDEHLFTVGRLDLSSEGMILVTNDGELANRLTHPKYGVEKTYVALVAGQLTNETAEKLRDGVHLAEGVARCVSVHVRKVLPQSTLVEIVLSEGKNREIRRILAKVGHKVLKLKRTAIGRVKLRDLKLGEFRRPTRDELQSLRDAADRPPKRRPKPRFDRKPQSHTPTTGDVTPIIDTRDSAGAWTGEESPARRPKPRPDFGKRSVGNRSGGKRDGARVGDDASNRSDERRGRRGRKKPAQRKPGSGTVIGADE